MVKTVVIAGIDCHSRNEKTNEINFFMKLKNLPQKFVNLAKKFDGENYEPDCFGFEYSYNIGSKTFTVEKTNGCALYYLDEDGDRHYMDYDIPENVKVIATKRCNTVLQKEGVKARRKSPTKKFQQKPVQKNFKEKNTISCVITLTLLIAPEKGRRRFVSGQYSLFSKEELGIS